MSTLVRAFPLKQPVEELETFVKSLRSERKEGAANFYRGYGVSMETWHIQETPMGPWVICVTVIDNVVESAERYAKSTGDFDVWFKESVRSLSEVNPDEQPLGPPTREIFAWPE